jgi:hypothetical protein
MTTLSDPRPLMGELAQLIYARFLTNSAGGRRMPTIPSNAGNGAHIPC